MEEIACILLIVLLLCFIYHIVNRVNCGCSNGVINGFSVGCEKGPVMCNPTADPPQNCPGEKDGRPIPCPQCGYPACECPTSPGPSPTPSPTPGPQSCEDELNELCGPIDVKGIDRRTFECTDCIQKNRSTLNGCDNDIITNWVKNVCIPGPSPPPGDLTCINSNFKGICIDDFSATINPNSWFGDDASKFKWPLTNYPIKVIRTYNWNDMKEWVIWALKNDIKVLLGVTNTDNITTKEKEYLKDNKKNIIGIVYWNEPKYNSDANAGPSILKDVLPNIPSMISYTHRNVNDYDTINDNILAVNIYGLYGNMCCCDDCSESNDQNTLNTQLPWNKGTILIKSFDDIFNAHPNIRLWITETGWSSYPAGCWDPNCDGDPNLRRKIAWSNIDNLTRNYKEFLKYDNTDSTKTPEYIFYFCLSFKHTYVQVVCLYRRFYLIIYLSHFP
jgi:hypothetical protein